MNTSKISAGRATCFSGLLLSLCSATALVTCRAEPADANLDAAKKAEIEQQKTRDQLLARGSPEVMQPAPVVDLNAPSPPVDTKALLKELVKPIGKDLVAIGDLRVDLAAGRVEIPAKVVLADGILEYLLVATNGKAYESVLATDAPALHMQLALTLAGLIEASADKKTLGDTVAIKARFRPAGAPRDTEIPASDLLKDRSTDKPPATLSWRFAGSPSRGGKTWATLTGSLIALRGDNSAIVGPSADLGNPYAGPNAGMAVNTKTVPPLGTPVTLIIAKASL